MALHIHSWTVKITLTPFTTNDCWLKFDSIHVNTEKLVQAGCHNLLWQGWRSGDSTCPPPMWPGFNFYTQRQMWIKFVGYLLCYERFFTGYSGFPLSPKTNIWFDLIWFVENNNIVNSDMSYVDLISSRIVNWHWKTPCGELSIRSIVLYCFNAGLLKASKFQCNWNEVLWT